MESGAKPDTAAKAALKKLEDYGERFLSMFDDDGPRKQPKPSTSGRIASQPAKVPLTGRTAAAKAKTSAPSADTAAQAHAAGTKAKGKQSIGQQRPASGAQPAGTLTTSPAGRMQKRGAATSAEDEINAIMRAGKKAKQAKASGSGLASKDGGSATAQAAAAAAQQAAMAEAVRRERKLFMSHKASKVHEAVSVEPSSQRSRAGAQAEDDDGGLTPEEFRKLHMEVEKFASSALDKKGAKQYKARVLERIGAKAEKAPRTAASIGKGVAKMATKRQARALEEAAESGMVQRKGMGKKKRALAAKSRDRGLMEAGPSFKNGILRVKPLKKTRAESGKLRLPKGVL